MSTALPSARRVVCLLALMALPLAACMVPERTIEATNLFPQRDIRTSGPIPAPQFPITIAYCQVQSRYLGQHCGSSSVVSPAEHATADALATLTKLPGVRAAVPITPLIASGGGGEEQIRAAAASLGAEVTLLYTFSSTESKDDIAPPIGFLSLGLIPTQTATSEALCSAILVDTRSGHPYASFSATYDARQLASGWTIDSARDDALHRSLRLSFENLTSQVAQQWPGLQQTIARGTPAGPAPQATQPYVILTIPPPYPQVICACEADTTSAAR